jgi:hypothetical protein
MNQNAMTVSPLCKVKLYAFHELTTRTAPVLEEIGSHQAHTRATPAVPLHSATMIRKC